MTTHIHLGLSHIYVYMPKCIDGSTMEREVVDVPYETILGEQAKDSLRLYWDEDKNPHPSTTTVLGKLKNHDKEFRINHWKNNIDFWEIMLLLHQKIGTWIHWAMLHNIDDSLHKTKEEEEAEQILSAISDLPEDTTKLENSLDLVYDDEMRENIESEITKSTVSYPEDIVNFDFELLRTDICEWVVGEATRLLQEKGNFSHVEHTEVFVSHPKMDTVYGMMYRYAGQADLIYIDEDGNRVMCDFKTSEEVHEVYYSQLMGYAKALEYHGYPIDRIEILRIDPVTQNESELKQPPQQLRDVYWRRFVSATRKTHTDYTLPTEPELITV